jgi:3-methyl-2-oxobutanoate hydroxymethyltransferase
MIEPNAARLIQEGGAATVKLEGGRSVADAVRRITAAGLPVTGHVRLTPQHVHRLGPFGCKELLLRCNLDEDVEVTP